MKFKKAFLLILLSFVSVSITAQLKHQTAFTSKNGFCSTTFILDSLGYFFREGGCEGRSSISFGKYSIQKDSVLFSFQPFDYLPFFINKVNSADLNDSISRIFFFTRNNTPVPKNHFSIDAIDTSGKFFKTFKLNDEGSISVSNLMYKELRINYLEGIYHKKIRIPLQKGITRITMSFPKLFFYYPKPQIENGENFSLLLKKDGLYSLDGKEKIFSSTD